eukprot:431909-Prorocentrum_minimum.AAC.2
MQQVSAGWGHVLALSECGVLLAWGHSAHGRLGLKPPRPASGGTQKAQITHNQPTVNPQLTHNQPTVITQSTHNQPT